MENINLNILRPGLFFYKSIKSGAGRTLIKALEISDMVKIHDNNSLYNYKPIPFDESIVTKNLGFEYSHKIRGRSYFQKGNFYLASEGKTKCDIYYKSENPICTYEYVHELQNLYLDLEGKELEFNQ